MGCIQVNIKTDQRMAVSITAGKGLDVSAQFNRPIQVTCGVICDVQKKYLSVNPDYIWLMPSNNFEDNVDVLSNVVWTAVQDE